MHIVCSTQCVPYQYGAYCCTILDYNLQTVIQRVVVVVPDIHSLHNVLFQLQKKIYTVRTYINEE